MAYIDRAKTAVWETPQALFDKLNGEYGFTLDPCALPENAKCERYFTPDDDGLSKNWGGRECSAIRRMGERFVTGLRRATKKAESPERLWSCFYRRGRTQAGFTTTALRMARLSFCEAG